MGGANITIEQSGNLKRVKKFIKPNGEITDGGPENLHTTEYDVGGAGGTGEDTGDDKKS